MPGINQAMLNWYIVDGDLVYVVWTDLPGGAGTSSGSSGSGTQTRESHVTTVELSDGRQFAFEYKLDRNTPQATGQLNIEDLTFDTRVGGLLMVSTTAETTEVRQAEIPQKLASSLTKEGQTRESLEVELQELAQAENPFKFYFENK